MDDAPETKSSLHKLIRAGFDANAAYNVAGTVLEQLQHLKLFASLQVTEIWQHQAQKAMLQVLDPYFKTYQCEVYGLTGSTSAAGVVAPLATERVLGLSGEVSGKVVIVSGEPDFETWQQLVDGGAKGFISAGCQLSSQDCRAIRPEFKYYGSVPGVVVSTSDAQELIQEKAREVRLVCLQQEHKTESQVLSAIVTGTRFPEHEIVIECYYDYRLITLEDLSGITVLMQLVQHYASNPLPWSLCFRWVGDTDRERRWRVGVRLPVRNNRRAKLILRIGSVLPGAKTNTVTLTGPGVLVEQIKQSVKFNKLGVDLVCRAVPMEMPGHQAAVVNLELNGLTLLDLNAADNLALEKLSGISWLAASIINTVRNGGMNL